MLHHVLLSVIITPAFAKLLRANRLPVARYMARVRDADIMCAAHKNLHCGRDARFGCFQLATGNCPRVSPHLLQNP